MCPTPRPWAVLPQSPWIPKLSKTIDTPRSADVCASGSQSGGCATWSRSGGFTCLASRMTFYVVMDVGVKGSKNVKRYDIPSLGHFQRTSRTDGQLPKAYSANIFIFTAWEQCFVLTTSFSLQFQVRASEFDY